MFLTRAGFYKNLSQVEIKLEIQKPLYDTIYVVLA